MQESMDQWKECMVFLQPVIIWRLKSGPIAVLFVVTAIFIGIWCLDPAVLTILSVFGFIITMLDYIIPSTSHLIFKDTDWSPDKQRSFDQLCQLVVDTRQDIHYWQALLKQWKRSRPILYNSLISITLLVFSLLGSMVDNFFLTYLFMLLLCLYPGIRHTGLLQRYLSSSILYITDHLQTRPSKSD